MTHAQVYNAAADAIRDRGHAKHLLCDPDTGGVCLLGAICLVVDGDPRSASPKAYKFLRPLNSMVPDGHDAVDWNNSDKTTKRQVVGLLRRAAAGRA